MRILVAWDDPAEAELLRMYMDVDSDDEEDHLVEIVLDHAALLARADDGSAWDAMLMATSSPDIDTAFETFVQFRRRQPDCPVVGACRSDDVFRVARFLMHGMRLYMIRDAAGDYVFLVQATLQNAIEAARAERERFVAEKLREEVESVRRLQAAIIPTTIESPADYDVIARYEPSQIKVFGGRPVTLAGGDYYDVFMLDEHRMVVLVGDAAGHGMRACMSIMTMHTLVTMIRSNRYEDTAAFVSEVNRRLCQQTLVQEEGGFITLLYGVLRTDTHEFEWTSAGHPLPILHDRESNEVRAIGTIDDGGMPLGIVPQAEYDTHRTRLGPRSRMLVFTDGLEEAFPEGNRDHAQFGLEGIVRTLEACRASSLPETLESLFAESANFTQGSGRHDDTSAVMIERLA